MRKFLFEIKIKVQSVSTCGAKVEDALSFVEELQWLTRGGNLNAVHEPRDSLRYLSAVFTVSNCCSFGGRGSFLSPATFAASAEVWRSFSKVRRNGVVMALLPLKVQNCFSRFSGTSPSLIASNKNWGPTATYEDEVLKPASYLLVMKKRADKSQLRPDSDERKEISPKSLLNSSRHPALDKAARSHAAVHHHSHTSSLTAAQMWPINYLDTVCSLLLKTLKPCSWSYEYRVSLYNEENVHKQLAWKSLFGWALEWKFRRKRLQLLKGELTSPLSLRASGKWDTKCQLKTSDTTMLQP